MKPPPNSSGIESVERQRIRAPLSTAIVSTRSIVPGVLACAEAETGKITWQQRGGSHWATPVIANGHMYCINQEGIVRVVKLGQEKGKSSRKPN